MDLAIIVLCWRHTAGLPALFDSIAAQRTRHRIATVLCHNAAADAAPPVQAPPFVRTICSGGNLGYGGGNNVAIAWARREFAPRHFLVLNPDVVLGEGALDALIDWADAHPATALVGAVQADPRAGGGAPRAGCRYHPCFSLIRPVPAGAGDIDYVNGGCLLLRADAFADPVFAEHYFLFFEELDLAARARAAGQDIACCAQARVLHAEGSTRDGVGDDDYRPEVAEYFENLNALRFTRDRHPYCLPTVLAFRLCAKPAALLLRGERLRLRFWALALGDFFLRRIRRFPFQRGWTNGGPDTLVDAPLPRRR